MADYDSDSSEGEFEETNVLLGYASKEADDEDIISRLGGRPDWLDPEKPPSAALARCKVCSDMMVQLLQLNGELPEKFPGHERRLHVFGCRRSNCRRRDGTVRVLRGVRVFKQEAPNPAKEEKKEQPKAEEAKPVALGDALFGASSFGRGGSANPFGGGGGTGSANPFAKPSEPEEKEEEKPKPQEVSTAGLTKSFAETLALNVPPAQPPPPPEPWPTEDKMPKPYPTLFLADADYETLDPKPTNVPANARVEAADAEEPSAIDREAFESSMDAAFQKFADRLAQNPEQVIRYEYAGTPLLYSKTDAIGKKLASGRGIPGCANCGGRRTFEVQLTPQAIVELEGDDMSLDGMEWGTIIVGVCERDCRPRDTELGQAGYLEEWAGVQWEELAKE